MSALAKMHAVAVVKVVSISATARLDNQDIQFLQPVVLLVNVLTDRSGQILLTFTEGPSGAEEDAMDRYTFEPIREYAIMTFK